MRIRDWMTADVITITADTSMMKASRLMKDNGINRLPVVDGDGRIVGIVSDRDVKAASPSKATTLDMHELYYLLSEIKVKDIMTRKPICAGPDDSVEQAAVTMIAENIGGMPVTDEDGHVLGIITDSDIFKVLISITGARSGGLQLGFTVSDAPGSLRPIIDLLRTHGASIISILTAQDAEQTAQGATRKVYFRVYPMPEEAERALIAEAEATLPLLYWQRGSAEKDVDIS